MKIRIGQKRMGDGQPILMVAEMSANHSRDLGTAVKTVRAAKKSGADAVKVQTYTPDTMTLDSKNPIFKIRNGTLWDGTTLYDLYKKAYMPWDWQPRLKEITEGLGMAFFSSAFDKTSVDFLDKMGVPAFKVASFEITDLPLIEYIAAKNKPVILSTGIATQSEIKDAVRLCRKIENNNIILLKCVSSYPSVPEEMNLKMIPRLAFDFGCMTGLSDHSEGMVAPVLSVGLGARMIEKHFTLDRRAGGPDAAFSMEPNEFKEMVDGVRWAERSMGRETYGLPKRAMKNRIFSRSLFAASDIDKGEELTGSNVMSLRPAFGLSPKYMKDVLGKRAGKRIKKGTPLSWGSIAG